MTFLLATRNYNNLKGLLIIVFMLSICSPWVEAVGVGLKSAGRCEVDKTCACIFNSNEYALHCEGDLHVTLQQNDRAAKFTCNNTIPSEALNRDYYSLLKLDSLNVIKLTFLECPTPPQSYSSLFLSQSNLLSPQNNTRKSDLMIANLAIICGARIEFNIERKLFEGLSLLSSLRIRCPVLTALPNDLLYEPLPKLYYLEISENRIEYIPELFFSRLESLTHLEFTRSHVKRLEKNSLMGLKSLQILNFSENKLNLIEDDAFDNLTNLIKINFNSNYITVLPKSLNSLTKLEMLDLGYNYLKNVTFDDCGMLSNLQFLDIMKNLLTEVSFECFSLMDQLTSIDISSNTILKLPENPISMERLDSFIFNHNSAEDIHLGQFLNAKSLLELLLSNSSIASVHPKLLHSLPNVINVDLSWNNIKFIPKDFFIHNYDLRRVSLQGNMLSTLPPEIFKENRFMYSLNISSNNISFLNATIFPGYSEIRILDISHNLLKEIPEEFLFNLRFIAKLDLSHNEIISLPSNLFINANLMTSLDLSYNMLTTLQTEIFPALFLTHPGKNLLSLHNLIYLNLAGNRFQHIPERVFHNLPKLEQLDLSRNLINRFVNSPLMATKQKLRSLDLSSNKIQEIPDYLFTSANNLRDLDLSNNNITRFSLECIGGAIRLHELNLSNNSMSFIGVYNDTHYRQSVRRHCHGSLEGVSCGKLLESCPIKVFKLSNNNLSFNYTQWKYSETSRTWGRVSPLIYCKNAEEIYLNDNFINEIFLDWRVDFSHLRRLDLRRNKLKYLSVQEQLFATVNFGGVSPYPRSHSLIVDLRENLINSVELPLSKLSDRMQGDKMEENYGHATFLLGQNPFTCGCGLLNFLRVLSNDTVLTSEIQRRMGKKWVLPAKFDVENLRCWLPKTVQGKKITEPEEWMHHILPMFGLCSLYERR